MLEPSSPVHTESTEAQTEAENTNPFELLEIAFSFVATEEELNPLLSGYFCKLITGLLKYKRVVVTKFIYEKQPEIL